MVSSVRSIAVALCSLAISAAAITSNASGAPTVPAYQTVWIHQFGGTDWDRAFGLATDGLGNLYTGGETTGSIGSIGPTNAGQYDAFAARYDLAGNQQWVTQVGTTGSDFGTGIAADSLGNVFQAGYSQGPLIPPGGGFQATLTRYAANGTPSWTQTLGTPQTYGYAVSADGLGNAYIAGSTLGSVNGSNAGGYDAYVAKYDSGGNLQWSNQFGTASQDQAYGVSADGLGSVYVTGSTTGLLAGPSAAGKNDVFLRKYDVAGAVQWTQQLGTGGDDIARTVSADALGNVFVAGSTSGGLGTPNSAGLDDAFVSKYQADGSLLWTKQLGTAGNDYISATAADGHGDVFVAGYTQGSLGKPNAGSYDAFVSEFNGAGDLLWTRQLGTSAADFIGGLTLDAQGNVYVSGSTQGSLAGPNQGSYDAWIAKLSPPLLGDLNHDFKLTNLDLQSLISAVADPVDFKASLQLTDNDFIALADVNGDGQVTVADISALMYVLAGMPIINNVGIVTSTGSVPVAVPEPTSLLLLAIGGAMLLARRFKQSR